MACPCANRMPTTAQMARNATAAAGRVVRAVVTGAPVKVSNKTYFARLEICRGCDQVIKWKHDESFLRCRKCGCWLNGNYIAKAKLATEACPLGKWGVE